MRIATWNVHRARDALLARIAREIVALHADAVCLNEVRRSQARRLGSLLDLRAYVAASFIGPSGNVILTNEPVRSWRRLRFSGVRRIDRRDAAIVDLAAGPTLAAIHLNSLRPDDRPRNAAELVRALPSRSIIAGDMNEDPQGPVGRELAQRFVEVCAEAGPTYPATEPRARIDQVWVPPAVRVLSCRTVPSTASDHLPLIVDLDEV